MDDFISREAEIQFFNDWVDDLDKQINDSVNCPHLRSDYKVCKTQLLDCIHAIKEMPSADVRPVVKAHWIYHEDDNGDYYECSHCHDEYVVYESDMEWKFCPTCGAMMEDNLDTTKGERRDESSG